MTRTEKLFLILIIIVFCLILVIYSNNKELVSKNIEYIISKLKNFSVVIPYEDTIYHNNYHYKTVKEDYTFKPNNIEDIKNIYYTVLNNGWDNFTFYCPKEYESCIDDIKLIVNGNDFISLINNYVSPYNSYKKYNTLIINDTEIYLSIEKLYNKNDINLINEEIDKIFNNLNINENEDTKETIKKLHDYLINNTKYDEDYDGSENTISNKANGALFNKIALCSGYTDTFALMLDKLNIPNFKVTNKDHIWNAVYYNNEWLHVDVTWDDDNRHNNNRYNFFMINTKQLLELNDGVHDFNTSNYLEFN